MGNPVISVIIPTFNRKASTLRAIESVLKASGRHAIEIIVVDDGSAEPFGETRISDTNVPVTHIRFETNKGPAAARNAGLSAAEGSLITFLDSDDRLLPGTLDKRIDFAVQAGCTADAGRNMIVACGWDDVRTDGTRLRTRSPVATRTASDFYAGCWFAPGSCLIASRQLFAQAEMRFDERLRRLEDYDLFLRLGADPEARLIVDPAIGAQIEHSAGRSSRAVFDAAAIIRDKLKALRRSGKMSARELRASLAYLNYEEAKFHFEKRAFISGGAHLAASWLRRPRLKKYPGPGWTISA